MPAKSRKTAGGMSVMDLDTAGFYRPRTKETRWVGGGMGGGVRDDAHSGCVLRLCRYMIETHTHTHTRTHTHARTRAARRTRRC